MIPLREACKSQQSTHVQKIVTGIAFLLKKGHRTSHHEILYILHSKQTQTAELQYGIGFSIVLGSFAD
jgi:hypothetical protein